MFSKEELTGEVINQFWSALATDYGIYAVESQLSDLMWHVIFSRCTLATKPENIEKIYPSFCCCCFVVERCGAVVKRRTRDREVPGSIPTNCKCCFLEQETLSTLLSIGFYPGKKRATWKISTRLLNVLPSINKVDYYYYYYYYYLLLSQLYSSNTDQYFVTHSLQEMNLFTKFWYAYAYRTTNMYPKSV